VKVYKVNCIDIVGMFYICQTTVQIGAGRSTAQLFKGMQKIGQLSRKAGEQLKRRKCSNIINCSIVQKNGYGHLLVLIIY
jgi:hypothetical protein